MILFIDVFIKNYYVYRFNFIHLSCNQDSIYLTRYIILTDIEREQLEQTYKTSTNFIERGRSFQILPSAKKNSRTEVSRIANIDRQAVIRLFNSWDSAFAESQESLERTRSVYLLSSSILTRAEQN